MTNVAADARSHGPSPMPSAPWRWAATFGLLGGVALVAMELLALPTGLSVSELREIVVKVVPQWIVTGVALACLTLWLERRVAMPWLGLALVFFAFAMSAGFAVLRHLARLAGLWEGTSILAARAPILPTFFYDAWVILFFGGLFMCACVLSIRSERTRSVLARAEIERGRAETMLGEAQLRTLQGHVDPAFLLRVLTEVARRYPTDSDRADALLDRFIGFLRRAMPAVREGSSTLAIEVALAQAYGIVCADLDPARICWRVRGGEAIPKVPFPPLQLLPVLDRWVAASAATSAGELVITRGAQDVTLTFEGPHAALGEWLPADMDYRLRTQLRAVCGSAWQLDVRNAMAPGSPALTLSLQILESEDSAPVKETMDERI